VGVASGDAVAREKQVLKPDGSVFSRQMQDAGTDLSHGCLNADDVVGENLRNAG
jgi:hypothetical protein